MGAEPLNIADIAILAAVFALLALIVRGMLRGNVCSCDPGVCGGSCQSCGQACGSAGIQLSDGQLAELAAIDLRAKEAESQNHV